MLVLFIPKPLLIKALLEVACENIIFLRVHGKGMGPQHRKRKLEPVPPTDAMPRGKKNVMQANSSKQLVGFGGHIKPVIHNLSGSAANTMAAYTNCSAAQNPSFVFHYELIALKKKSNLHFETLQTPNEP